MTKLARVVVATALPLTLLVGCTAGVDEPDADPTFSLDPSAPSPSSTGLPANDEIAQWAAIALPEDRAGAAAPVLRTSGPLSPAAGAVVDIEQPEGLWEVAITCQSIDVSPISWQIASPTASAEWTELDCAGPGGAGTPTTTVIAFDGPGAQLSLTSEADAVYAVEVRAHNEPLD